MNHIVLDGNANTNQDTTERTMTCTKRNQIENRLHDMGRYTLVRAYNRGRRVWAAMDGGRGVYTLSSGLRCLDYWRTLAEAHTAIFETQGIRADNYNQ